MGPGGGLVESTSGGRGDWLKSKSPTRSSRKGTFSLHGGTRVRAAIIVWVQALTVQENIHDEFEKGIESQSLMIDVAYPGRGAHDQAGNARSIAIFVNFGVTM